MNPIKLFCYSTGLFLLLFSANPYFTSAQSRQKRPLLHLLQQMVSADTSEIEISNTDFYNIEDGYEEFKSKADSVIIVNRNVRLLNCRFDRGVTLSEFNFKKSVYMNLVPFIAGTVYDGELCVINIQNSQFHSGLNLDLEKGEMPFFVTISDNKINKSFSIIAENTYSLIINNTIDVRGEKKVYRLIGNSFWSPVEKDEKIADDQQYMKKQEFAFRISVEGPEFMLEKNAITFNVLKDSLYDPSFSDISIKAPNAIISWNKINKDPLYESSKFTYDGSLKVGINDQVRNLQITNNEISCDLSLDLNYSLNSLLFYHNKLRKVGFLPFKIPEESNVIMWNDLMNAEFGLITKPYGVNENFYTAFSGDQIKDKLAYKELVKFYKKFYDRYKSSGDISSANNVYVRIKDLETAELKSSYSSDPNFNLYFRLQLNRLLKYYTAYGTDPAQAMVASFWIILLFAIFYFFFPSNWDITSKSDLLKKYKDFIEKNEKGYVVPFFKMLQGFFISLLNAVESFPKNSSG